MKMNTRQKLEILQAEFNKARMTDKDYHEKRYYYQKESYKLKSEFIDNFVKHFNLTTSEAFQTDDYTFCLYTEILNYSTFEHTCIRNIKDVSTAFILMKRLLKVGINTTLCYTVPSTTSWNGKHSSIESFTYKSFNYHARYVLRVWNIKEENNTSKLTENMFK